MKLIKTDMYLLLIDEKAEKKNDNYAMGYDKKIILCTENNRLSIQEHWKLVIAYLPLTKEAKELDLPLLPPFKDLALEFANEIKQDVSQYDNGRWYGRIEGYKAAHPKQFNLEDIKKAIEMAKEGKLIFNPEEYGFDFKYTGEEIIQSLSTQQYPKEFIPVKEYKTQSGEWKEVLLPSEWEINTQSKFKTIINSKGKTELVGTYQH